MLLLTNVQSQKIRKKWGSGWLSNRKSETVTPTHSTDGTMFQANRALHKRKQTQWSVFYITDVWCNQRSKLIDHVSQRSNSSCENIIHFIIIISIIYISKLILKKNQNYFLGVYVEMYIWIIQLCCLLFLLISYTIKHWITCINVMYVRRKGIQNSFHCTTNYCTR